MATPQNFKNHARYVPGYHVVTFLLMFGAAVLSIIAVVKEPTLAHIALMLLALGATVATYYARAFPLGVQDRVIRLEERLRLERVLPDDLKARIGELSIDQLIGLRYASDGEVADLTRRVLTEGIAGRKDIKALVKDWRADHARI